MTTTLLARTLSHLEWLVAARTENPPRNIAESGIIERLVRELEGRCTTTVTDLGNGSINVFARRGAPRILYNFHLDTVPAASAWTGSPFALRIENDRAVGLGACDIKGAVAAMLSAVEASTGDVALLFSTDEEAGHGRCIEAFLADRPDFDAVVVAEPTRAHAVLAHRGIGTTLGRFSGRAGHASRADAIAESANHAAVRWAVTALDDARDRDGVTSQGLSGIRFNLGRIDGGLKPNVVADSTVVRFGVRPPPGIDPRRIVDELQALATAPGGVSWEDGFIGPSLPHDPEHQVAPARTLATKLGLPLGDAVDFWTEAALFSARGYPAVVFGPGDIAQAHAKDEWVLVSELASVAATYQRAIQLTR